MSSSAVCGNLDGNGQRSFAKQMKLLTSLGAVILLSFDSGCNAERRNRWISQKAISIVNNHAKSMLNLTSTEVATVQFIQAAKAQNLEPKGSDFDHLFVGIIPSDDCYSRLWRIQARFETRQATEVVKFIYKLYLQNSGSLKSPLVTAVVPRTWSLCRRESFDYRRHVRYDIANQKVVIKNRLRYTLDADRIVAKWRGMRMFSIRYKFRMRYIWRVVDPLGGVLPKLRELMYKKIDGLRGGKPALNMEEKEDLFTNLISNTIYLGPKCEGEMTGVRLGSTIAMLKLSKENPVLCLDQSGGNGPFLNYTTHSKPKEISAQVLRTVTSIIDNLTTKDIYKSGEKQHSQEQKTTQLKRDFEQTTGQAAEFAGQKCF